MRYLFILLILLTGCSQVRYYPFGDDGTRIPYKIDYLAKTQCDYCKKGSELFKITSNGKIMCHKCYQKRVKKW